jgi:hypothetical protein
MKERNLRNFMTFFIALAAAVAGLGCAQVGAKVPPPGQAKKGSPMTVEDVVTLAKAGVSEEVILAQLSAKHASFDLTADQLIQLKSASVSERVIRAMMELPAPQNAPAKTAASAPALGSPATAPAKKLEAEHVTAVPATVTTRAAGSPKSVSSPQPNSRAAAPAKTPKARPATPTPATVTARAAVPVEPVSSPVPAQWIAHNDPMGFSVNTPPGWELHADRQAGRINIRGPQGQQAVIWPMFIPQQQLDARGAGTVVQQLARRVDAKMA